MNPNVLESRVPANRSELLSLLSEACELEHGLACSYLYAAFSLKQDLREGGITWEQLQLVRKWAAQIYFVASEEMLHLAQAWNLLLAIGGTPYYLRPNFPQGPKYYPLGANLVLEPFGLQSLQRFVYYERPQNVHPSEACSDRLGIVSEDEGSVPAYSSVGELYSLIRKGFEHLSSKRLIIGDPSCQIGQDLVDFPDIIKVVDLSSALRGIDMIVEQGEGNASERTDSHFGVFVNLLQEYETELANTQSTGNVFEPTRRVAVNPIARLRADLATGSEMTITIIEDEYTRSVSELFDEIYMLMLRMLQYLFSGPRDTSAALLLPEFARIAITLMPIVIKPLGEALTLLPTGGPSGQTAGPSFSMGRHVPLPADANSTQIVVKERLEELSGLADDLARLNHAPAPLRAAAQNLKKLIIQ